MDATRDTDPVETTEWREALDSVLDRIEREHGSVREYLLAAGLTLHDLGALERVLLGAADEREG